MNSKLIILDTSFLIQCFIGRNQYLKEIADLVKSNRVILCTCVESLLELQNTIADNDVKKYLIYRQSVIAKFMAWYKYNTEIFEIENTHTLDRDPKDSMWLNLIESSQAQYLVTNDKDLLEVQKFQNCKIVRIRDLIEVI